MAESAPVEAPRSRVQLPAEVEVHREDLTSVAFTPRQLDAIRETFDRSWSEIMSDEKSDDKFKIIAWLKLQDRLGSFPFEPMRDVKIRLDMEPTAPDPTETPSSPISSDSAGSGE